MSSAAPTKSAAVKVDIQLLSKSYAVACEAGEEKRLEALAGYVDTKLRTLQGGLSSAQQERLFMLSCLMLADEVFDLKGGKSTAAASTSILDEATLTAMVETLTERLGKITQKLQG